MNRLVVAFFSALALPATALAATRTYEARAFDSVTVAAGIEVEIIQGATHRVLAETRAEDFDDLRISVDGDVLRIDRPRRSWFLFWRRPDYAVRVTMPVLRSLTASSGAEVDVQRTFEGDLTVKASSGSEIEVAAVQRGAVVAHVSSGSDLRIAGSCTRLEARVSSGSDLDAHALRCETADLHASSGSDVSLLATHRLTGAASSGSDVDVRGMPATLQLEKSSGADVRVRQ